MYRRKMGVAKRNLGRNRRLLAKVGLLRENGCGKGDSLKEICEGTLGKHGAFRGNRSGSGTFD